MTSENSIIPPFPQAPKNFELMRSFNPNHPAILAYKAQMKVYWAAINKQKELKENKNKLPDFAPICLTSFYEHFLWQFEKTNKKPFDPNANHCEALQLSYLLLHFFAKEWGKDYTLSPLINKQINEPNRDKGLLIIGNFGTGKTSQIKTFYNLLRQANTTAVKDVNGNYQPLSRYNLGFQFHTANDLVANYESLKSPEEKADFWKKHENGLIYFDDLMTERMVNNFGKFDLMKDVLEKRYTNQAKTIISLNYTPINGECNTETTLKSIGERYGSRIYDRLFEMFNVVELRGKSLRK